MRGWRKSKRFGVLFGFIPDVEVCDATEERLCTTADYKIKTTKSNPTAIHNSNTLRHTPDTTLKRKTRASLRIRHLRALSGSVDRYVHDVDL